MPSASDWKDLLNSKGHEVSLVEMEEFCRFIETEEEAPRYSANEYTFRPRNSALGESTRRSHELSDSKMRFTSLLERGTYSSSQVHKESQPNVRLSVETRSWRDTKPLERFESPRRTAASRYAPVYVPRYWTAEAPRYREHREYCLGSDWAEYRRYNVGSDSRWWRRGYEDSRLQECACGEYVRPSWRVSQGDWRDWRYDTEAGRSYTRTTEWDEVVERRTTLMGTGGLITEVTRIVYN